MDIAQLAVGAIGLIIIVAIAAIVYWFIAASGVTVPRPVQIALYAVIAVIAILFLVHLAGVNNFGGGGRVIQI